MAHCWHRGKDEKGKRIWYCCMCKKAPSEVNKDDRPWSKKSMSGRQECQP